MSTARIVTEVAKFDALMRNGNARQLATNPDTGNAYYIDYGWTPAESGAFTTDWHDKWVNDIYPKHINPDTSTSAQKAKTEKFMKDFVKHDHDHHLLDKVVICGKANASDAQIWNVVLIRHAPTHLTSKIATKPWASMERSGINSFEIKLKSASDASLPSIDHEHGADSAQYSYAIFDHNPSEEESRNPDNEHFFTKGISKKSHFYLTVSAEHRRKWIVIYFRWYNETYPQFAGDWTEMITAVIG